MSRPFSGGNRRRKTISLDGTVAGIEYNHHHAGYNHTPFDRQTQIDSPQPQREYQPHPGQPEFFQTSYEPYEWEMHPRQTPALRLDPIRDSEDPPPTYDKGAMTQVAFEHSMQQFLMEHQQAITEASEKVQSAIRDPAIAPESLERVIETSGQIDPLIAMIFELEEQVTHMEHYAESLQPPPQQEEPDPQQIYEEQMRQFLDPFNMMGPGPMG